MICSVRSLAVNGIQGSPIVAECYISNGLPGFDIVGLPDAAVKEARERVRAAAKNSGFSLSRNSCGVGVYQCVVVPKSSGCIKSLSNA